MTTLSRCPRLIAFSLCAVSACSNSYGKSVGQMGNADEAETSDCLEPSPAIQYVSQDPVECQELAFECPLEGGEAFSDDCGCGCIVKQALDCPDPDDPAVHYIAESHDDPGFCEVVFFTCADEQTRFASPDCGCGCIDNQAPKCPDAGSPKVHYIGNSNQNPEFCQGISVTCEDSQAPFSTAECGCGCIDK